MKFACGMWNGINLLLLRHIGFITFISTIKTTAAIIMAARADLGMYANRGVINISDNTTSTPKKQKNSK